MLIKADRSSNLMLIEGFFDAEGCVKIIIEKIRKTPKVCLDITNTNYELLEIIRKIFEKYLCIKAKYSIQKSFIGKDGSKRKKTFHLRIKEVLIKVAMMQIIFRTLSHVGNRKNSSK